MYEEYTESLFNYFVAVGCDEKELKRLMFDADTGKWKRPVNELPAYSRRLQVSDTNRPVFTVGGKTLETGDVITFRGDWDAINVYINAGCPEPEAEGCPILPESDD